MCKCVALLYLFISGYADEAILDSGCAATVAGTGWLLEYERQHNGGSRLARHTSKLSFSFGKTRTLSAICYVLVPLLWGPLSGSLRIDIVPGKTPLLVSMRSMERMGLVMNFARKTLHMDRQGILLPMNMYCSSQGHWCFRLHNNAALKVITETPSRLQVMNGTVEEIQDLETEGVQDCLEEERTLTYSMPELQKLHVQYGHASKDKLFKLLSRVSKCKHLMGNLDKVIQSCKTCKEFSSRPVMPVVSIPKFDTFNTRVGADLMLLHRQFYVLHIVCLGTRYSEGLILKRKDPATVTEGFLKCWVYKFGAPSSMLTDNGGEFVNETFRLAMEKFQIRHHTTPAESPWALGTVERANGTLLNMMRKVFMEKSSHGGMVTSEQLSRLWKNILLTCLHAKNVMPMYGGVSPYQLTFGRYPNIQSPSGLGVVNPVNISNEEYTEMAPFLKSLDDLFTVAREKFFCSEIVTKNAEALKAQTRNFDRNLELGTEVWYYRKATTKLQARWRGPGVIVGKDSNTLLIKHGGKYIKIHQCMVKEISEPGLIQGSGVVGGKPQTSIVDSDENELEEIPTPENLDHEHEGSPPDPENFENKHEHAEVPPAEHMEHVMEHEEQHDPSPDKEIPESEDEKRKRKLKEFRKILEQEMEFDEEINDEEEEEERMVGGTEVTPQEAMSEAFLEAKEKELNSWKEMGVIEEIQYQPDMKSRIIKGRWVCVWKKTPDEPDLAKARFVAKGFQDPEAKEIAKEAPTVSKFSFRLCLCIAANKGWTPLTIDIKCAFLHADMPRTVILQPPAEARVPKDTVWLLKKAVYGLVDSPRWWYVTLVKLLKELGLVQIGLDPGLFMAVVNGKMVCLVCVHVDDLLCVGEKNFLDKVIQQLGVKVRIGTVKIGNFIYLGVKVTTEADEGDGLIIKVDQAIFAEALEVPHFDMTQDIHSALNQEQITHLRNIIGSVMWLSTQSRPDLAFNVSMLAGHLSSPVFQNLLQGMKLIKRAKKETPPLSFLNIPLPWKLVLYTDASWANMPNHGSQGGFLLVLTSEKEYNKGCLIHWGSNRIKRVCRSTFSAEVLSLMAGIDHAILISKILSQLVQIEVPLDVKTDCNSIVDHLYSLNPKVTEKRLLIDILIIRQAIQAKEIRNVSWICTKSQLADSLTKSMWPVTLLEFIRTGEMPS